MKLFISRGLGRNNLGYPSSPRKQSSPYRLLQNSSIVLDGLLCSYSTSVHSKSIKSTAVGITSLDACSARRTVCKINNKLKGPCVVMILVSHLYYYLHYHYKSPALRDVSFAMMKKKLQ